MKSDTFLVHQQGLDRHRRNFVVLGDVGLPFVGSVTVEHLAHPVEGAQQLRREGPLRLLPVAVRLRCRNSRRAPPNNRSPISRASSKRRPVSHLDRNAMRVPSPLRSRAKASSSERLVCSEIARAVVPASSARRVLSIGSVPRFSWWRTASAAASPTRQASTSSHSGRLVPESNRTASAGLRIETLPLRDLLDPFRRQHVDRPPGTGLGIGGDFFECVFAEIGSIGEAAFDLLCIHLVRVAAETSFQPAVA